VEKAAGKSSGDPLIVMDSSFSCLVYPEIEYADALQLAEILNVREAGPTVRFELTRDSVVRAFDRGISAEQIISLLRRLAAGRIAETLNWTVKDWEKRYGEVSLRRGLVLSLSPERRYLAETAPLSKFIRETLAPGVYLLDEDAETGTEEALRNAGVDIIARRGKDGIRRTDEKERLNTTAFPQLAALTKNPVPNPAKTKEPASNRGRTQDKTQSGTRGKKSGGTVSAATLIAGFHTILEAMRKDNSGLRLSETGWDELAARINRRLILCEAQLRDASVRYEKLEARGLDYAGKLNIAKQAIALQAPVELVRPGKDRQEEERIFGIPKALEKEKNESVLIIEPYGTGSVMRIPIGKISLLRRIKKSIFETNTL
jgi:hypothetical protein